MKKIFLVFVFTFLLASRAQAARINDVPTLRTVTFDGKIFDLKEKRGKVVIINFWAKWCGYCRKEMPILDQLYKKYQSSGLEIIGLNLDRKTSQDAAKNFAAQFSYPNSSFFDATEISFDHPLAIPVSYVIDREGRLKAVLQGNEDEADMFRFENVLRPLLSQ
jgi:thiol-disulfide isomerase/thioredoxin